MLINLELALIIRSLVGNNQLCTVRYLALDLDCQVPDRRKNNMSKCLSHSHTHTSALLPAAAVVEQSEISILGVR